MARNIVSFSAAAARAAFSFATGQFISSSGAVSTRQVFIAGTDANLCVLGT